MVSRSAWPSLFAPGLTTTRLPDLSCNLRASPPCEARLTRQFRRLKEPARPWFRCPGGTEVAPMICWRVAVRCLPKAFPSIAPQGVTRRVNTATVNSVPNQERPPGSLDVALFERISAEIGDEVLGPPGTRPG